MKSVLLLIVFWCSSLLAVNNARGVIDGYHCVSDYWFTISCVLKLSGDAAGQNRTNYRLEFIWKDVKKFSCPLVMMDHNYSCTVAAYKPTDPTDSFMTVDELAIHLCYEAGCHTVIEEFKPSKNFQPTPPHDVVVQETPEDFNVTWKSGYENHKYVREHLQYELSLQNLHSTDYKVLTQQSTNSISVQKSSLDPGTEYCIKVKSLPSTNSEAYHGSWSNWSPVTCWKTEASEEQEQERSEVKEEREENKLLILTKFVGPVCVAVVVLLFLFYNPVIRMKIRTLSHTPSPAPFFQPLFKEHKGNFQEWISPQGNGALPYKTEEMMKTDALIIVPKPITKDQEEHQDVQEALLTQMMFTQCQSSYVGLPGMDGPPLHLSVNCQGNTSYTQLPISALKFDFGEAEVVASSPPESVLEISCADSGCGCEDLTQSPECSSPSSPIHASPPQCLCADYCILNKTAAGIIPILITKGNSVNIPSESLQKDES